MTSFKTLVSTLVMFVSIVGCVKADRNSSSDLPDELNAYRTDTSLLLYNNRAFFEAGNIELENIQFSRATDDSFQQVDQIRLWLKVCQIRDRASQGTLRNERFMISSEVGDNVYMTQENQSGDLVPGDVSNPIVVNQGNCLRWSQLVPAFSYVAPSVNLVLHYEIESISGTLGKMVRRVGFNPWDMYRNNSKSRGFLDLTDFNQSDWGEGQWITGKDSVIAALKGELLDNTAQLSLRNLVVQPLERENQNSSTVNEESLASLSPEERQRYINMRTEIDRDLQRNAGLQISINMNAKPIVRVNDATGVPHDIELNSGRFRVHMNLVASRATEDGERFLLSSNVAQITGRGTAYSWDVNENGLRASVPLVMRTNCQNCRLELAMKVEPVSRGLRQVKPFSAVFDLGEYNQWMNRQSPTFRFDENYQAMDRLDYDRFIEGIVGNTTENVSTLRPQERFYFQPLVIRFVRIMPGETATDRTLQYRVESCVQNGLYGNRVGRGLWFEVKTYDQGREQVMQRQTNEAGCLMWFGLLSHKYYRKEVLQEKYAEIRYLGSRSQTNSQGRRSAVDETPNMINPYNKRFTYYMNPWDEKFTFGWDEPDMPEGYVQEIQQLQNTAPVSRLFLADFKYQTMGFRYEIDKFLRLKVKKSILLQAYPFVLKYNSIVEGRQRTERLRDGIYLMKVALHKFYLDPAARGVRIYDANRSNNGANAESDPYNRLDSSSINFVEEGENLPSAYDVYDAVYGPLVAENEEGISPESRMTDARGNDVDYSNIRLIDAEEQGESQKEYISHMTQLIRVQGGQIITPVEFDMYDLRLMRIRNQFLIQLETIDENMLRLATFLDSTINDMNQDGQVEDRLAEINRLMEGVEDLNDPAVIGQFNQLDQALNDEQTARQLEGLDLTVGQARERLKEIFGLNQFEEGSAEYNQHVASIRSRLEFLTQYRQRVREDGENLDFQNAFRNQKRAIIQDLMRSYANSSSTELNNVQDRLNDQQRDLVAQDPFLRYMFLDNYQSANDALQSLVEYRAQRAEEMGDPSFALDLNSLRSSDFTRTPLTPTVDFEFLRTDGAHDHHLEHDDGKSGLPSRTFIGPLTFVFNTNGSALRPTDALNESDCATAFCEAPRLLDSQSLINAGLPPEPVEVASQLDQDGSFLNSHGQPVYAMADSVNSNYENNEYYGYLRVYRNIKVDDLINREKQIRERDYRRLEQGSQIINFVKTYDLKYTTLDESNPQSQLKAIDHDCAENIAIERISECFTPMRTGEQLLSKQSLLEQMNARAPILDSAFFPRNGIQGRELQQKNIAYFNAVEGEVTESDIRQIMEKGWESEDIDPDIPRRFMHRMCYVLSQNLVKEEYLRSAPGFVERDASHVLPDDPSNPALRSRRADLSMQQRGVNQDLINSIEERCHRYVGRIYNYYPDQESWTGAFRWEGRGLNRARESGLRPVATDFKPLIMERKVRVYETTDRYVYRGGKSLNINVAANFNLNAGEGIKTSTSSNYKPWETAVSMGAILAGGAIGVIGGPVGVAMGSALGAAASSSLKTIVSMFNLTRSTGRDESVYSNQGVSVSAATFLVNQQATFDIEFGEYERCMVVRLHPMFVRDILDANNEPSSSSEQRVIGALGDHLNYQGVLICSGQRERNCLPVKEKYYYFTQHFTEGDMLDTADLHNHPWLLQMRGYRDFMAFTSVIGGRGLELTNNWRDDVLSNTMSDAAAFRLAGSRVDNMNPRYQVVNRHADTNWPLEELGRVYFDVLPTFPSIYTYIDETGSEASDWPYRDSEPSRSFQQCEQ